jgi:ribosome modulation factor
MANSKERQRRMRKAFERGYEARIAGESSKRNPFVISAGGTGQQWEKGWRQADADEKRRSEA